MPLKYRRAPALNCTAQSLYVLVNELRQLCLPNRQYRELSVLLYAHLECEH